jgi:hypothetical protein
LLCQNEKASMRADAVGLLAFAGKGRFGSHS